MDEILDSEASSTIACEATDVTLEVEFSIPIVDVSYPAGATFSGNIATLAIGNITSDGTDVLVQLETCTLADGIISVVTNVSYSDDQGNSPDFTSLLDAGEAQKCTPGPTPALTTPTSTPSPITTTPTTPAPTISTPPTTAPTTASPPTGGLEPYDCTMCSDLTDAQKEALAGYDNGGKKIVCDPTCVDGISDPIHCNCECNYEQRLALTRTATRELAKSWLCK